MIKKITLAIFVLAIVLLSSPTSAAYLDDLEEMANQLTKCKDSAMDGEWSDAQDYYKNIILLWGRVKSQFEEDENRKERVGEVDQNLSLIDEAIGKENATVVSDHVNKCIWAISYQPDGFNAPEDGFTLNDWVLALVIGLGFDVFAIAFGLHLRRTYRRGSGR